MLDDSVTETIRQVVSDQLDPARVVGLHVRDDLDHDGERILRIDVTFELEGGRLDPQKVIGLARHLREPLEALHIDAYPVFSFLKPEDMTGAAA